MKRYPAYKESGVEWLGEVPEGWSDTKIRYIANFQSGGTPSRDNPAYWNGEIPWISPKDMKCRYISTAEESITDAGLNESATSLIRAGAVLMVVRSGILKHTIPIALNTENVALNQDVKAITLDPAQMMADYFVYFVEGFNDPLLLAWSKQGATVESIEHQYLTDTRIPLPPLPEQRTIADFLDRETAKIDALVEEQRRLIALLAEKRQAVISHAVTKGLNPDASFKPSGIDWLGDIPEGWEVVPLRRVVDRIESGTSVNAADLPADENEIGVLKTSCVYSGEFNPAENKTVISADLGRVSCPLRAGTVIVSRMNTPDLVGAAGLVSDAPTNIYLPDRLWQVSFVDADAGFIHFWTQTGFYRDQVKAACAGTSSSMQNLSQDDFRSFRLALPSTAEQQAIIARLREDLQRFDALTEAATSAIALLQERRAALISAAVTGKIDLRDEAALVQESA